MIIIVIINKKGIFRMLLKEWMKENNYKVVDFAYEANICTATVVRAKKNLPVFKKTVDKIFEFTKGAVTLIKKEMPKANRRPKMSDQHKRTVKAFCLRRYYAQSNELFWPKEWETFESFVKHQGFCPKGCEYFGKKDKSKDYSTENFKWNKESFKWSKNKV